MQVNSSKLAIISIIQIVLISLALDLISLFMILQMGGKV